MIKQFGDLLRAIPGPTDAWAEIIGSLAWPAVVVFLVLRFRRYLRVFLNTIATRLETDHVKLGIFEMTPNSQVIALDPERAGSASDDYDPGDIKRIEELFEYVGKETNLNLLIAWVSENVGSALEITEFLTSPEYAIERESAYEALVVRGR